MSGGLLEECFELCLTHWIKDEFQVSSRIHQYTDLKKTNKQNDVDLVCYILLHNYTKGTLG